MGCGNLGTEMTRGAFDSTWTSRISASSSCLFKVDARVLGIDHLATTVWSALQDYPSTARDADISRGWRVYAQISAARGLA